VKPKRLEKIPGKYQRSVEESLKQLSQALQNRRESLELTQEALAEKLGIGTTTLQAIERGRRYPSLPTLYYICQVLEIDIRVKVRK
jgi:transcriptional regulator with XRE-family HTH domain